MPTAENTATRMVSVYDGRRKVAVAEVAPLVPPPSSRQIKSLPPAIERKLFGYAPFASGLPTAFLGRRS